MTQRNYIVVITFRWMNDKTLTANPPKLKALEHLKQHMTKTALFYFYKEHYVLV